MAVRQKMAGARRFNVVEFMRHRITVRPIIVRALQIQCGLAVALAISPFVPVVGLLTLPLTWPAIFVLGDESDERFGVLLELALAWIMAFPMALLYAGLHSYWCHIHLGMEATKNGST